MDALEWTAVLAWQQVISQDSQSCAEPWNELYFLPLTFVQPSFVWLGQRFQRPWRTASWWPFARYSTFLKETATDTHATPGIRNASEHWGHAPSWVSVLCPTTHGHYWCPLGRASLGPWTLSAWQRRPLSWPPPELPLEVLRPLEGALGDRPLLPVLPTLEAAAGVPGAPGPVSALLQALGFTQDPSLVREGRGSQDGARDAPGNSIGSGQEALTDWKLPLGCLQGCRPVLLQALSQMLTGIPGAPAAGARESLGASGSGGVIDGRSAAEVQGALERELRAGVAALEAVQHSYCVEQAQQDLAASLPLFLRPGPGRCRQGEAPAPPASLPGALAVAKTLSTTVSGLSTQRPSSSYASEGDTQRRTRDFRRPGGVGKAQVARGLVQTLVLLSARAVVDASAQHRGVGVQGEGEGSPPSGQCKKGLQGGGVEGREMQESTGRGWTELAGALAECVCCCCGDERGSLSPLLDDRSFLLLLGSLQGALLASAEARGHRQRGTSDKAGKGTGGGGEERGGSGSVPVVAHPAGGAVRTAAPV